MRAATGALVAMTLASVCLASSPALAHGEEALLLVFGSGLAWQALIGGVMVLPRRMRGRRLIALAIYVVAAIIAWMINLAIPIDSFADFWPVVGLPLLAAAGLIVLATPAKART